MLLEFVFRYAQLQYSPERICLRLGMSREQREIFLGRLEDPDDPISIKYNQGLIIGDYKVDKMLEKAGRQGNALAIAELSTRLYHRKQEQNKKDLFGIDR